VIVGDPSFVRRMGRIYVVAVGLDQARIMAWRASRSMRGGGRVEIEVFGVVVAVGR